jgi:hypothetical protein
MALAETSGAPPSGMVAAAAPLGRRFLAALIDFVLASAPITLAVILRLPLGAQPIAWIAVALASASIWIVNDLVSVARTGQSVGRRYLGIQVLDSHAMNPPTLGQVALRNLVAEAAIGIAWHPFTGIPMFFVLGPWPLICYAPAVADRRWHRALHDRWSHTVVIELDHDTSRFGSS